MLPIDSFKTVCLAKYRKVKLNNGLLDVVDRERLPSGTYKITYETPFHPGEVQDMLPAYLDWHAAWAKRQQEAKA